MLAATSTTLNACLKVASYLWCIFPLSSACCTLVYLIIRFNKMCFLFVLGRLDIVWRVRPCIGENRCWTENVYKVSQLTIFSLNPDFLPRILWTFFTQTTGELDWFWWDKRTSLCNLACQSCSMDLKIENFKYFITLWYFTTKNKK